MDTTAHMRPSGNDWAQYALSVHLVEPIQGEIAFVSGQVTGVGSAGQWRESDEPIASATWINPGEARVFLLKVFSRRYAAGEGARWTTNFWYSFGSGGSGFPPNCPPIPDSETNGPNPARNGTCSEFDVADPVSTRTGNLHLPLPGLSVAGRGPGLPFELAYNSLNASREGMAGYGWDTTLDMRMIELADGSMQVVQEQGSTVVFAKSGSDWVAPDRFSATLIENADGSFTFTRNHFESFVFDGTSGRLEAIADQFGNETTISYDASGRATMMEDEAGRKLTFGWDGDLLESVTDPRTVADGGARQVFLGYSSLGDLESYTDASGAVWSLHYDELHRLTQIRKPRHGATGPAIVNTFDESNRVVLQVDEEQRETAIDYDEPAVGSTTVTTPGGLVQVDVYEDGACAARILEPGEPHEMLTEFERDPDTLAMESMVTPAGTWTYTNDPNGNRLSMTDPTGRVTRWTYNDFDQITSVEQGETAAPMAASTAAVVRTEWDFDPDDGRLLQEVVAKGTVDQATTTYQYTDSTNPEDLTSITDGRGKVWAFHHNGATGDLLQTVDPLLHTTTFEPNSIGWLRREISPRGNAAGATAAEFTTTFTRDGFGRVLSASGPEGTSSTWLYDPNGNLVQTVAGVGSPDSITTTYAYDLTDRLATVDPPGPGSRSYTTHDDGQQASFTNELEATWSYGLDELGRLQTITDPLSNVTTHAYDEAGRLRTVEDPTGHVTTYGYDAAGRPKSVDYADPATPDLANITYDQLGRRVSAAVGPATESWDWSFANRLEAHVDVNGRSTTYGWDDTGNLTSIGYPGAGTLTRRFDNAGRLDRVTDWSGRVTDFAYDENDNWKQTTFPTASANIDLYAYDHADRLTGITWRRSSTIQGSLTHTPRSALGQVSSTTAAGTAGTGTTWDYDARGRLTNAGTETFAHDAAGNLVEGPDGVLGVFDPAQRLCWTSPTATGGDCSTPTSDATTFGYDEAGRRTGMTYPSGTAASYGYDGAGRLESATVPAVTELSDRQYQTLAPAVVANTATGVGSCDGGTCSTLVANDPVEVRVAGNGGVPASGVVAVTGTLTVTNPTADGFVELNPNGDAAGGVIAAEAGTTSSGGFTAALDAQGDLVLNASVGANVAVEISGYFTPPPIWVAARNYWPVTPTTIGTGSVASGTTNVTVAGVGGVPAGASAVTVTLLAQASGAGNLRFAPNGAASAGTVSWDAAFPLGSGSYTVPVNPDGTITIAASITASTNMSVTGYWAVPTADGTNVGLGLELLPTGAQRVLDTTNGTGTCVPAPCDTVINAAAPTQVTVAGVAGVPADADAVLVSVAATGTGYGLGAVSSSAAGGNVAALAFDAGIVASASVIVPIDDDGTIDVSALYTSAEFTIDVIGHFSQPDTTMTYAYGADGLRTSATQAGGSEIEYTWSAAGGLPLLLAQHTGSSTSYLVYGPGGAPLYQVTAAGQPVYFHLDHLGSVRHTTAANGNARGALTYSAWGEVTSNTTNWAAEQPLLGFAGEYHDPITGFIYLRARHYDPSTGQFLTPDPLVAITHEPYVYASGDPANYKDPTGLCAFLCVVAVGIVIGAAADLASQALNNALAGCDPFSNIDWGSVARSGAWGGLTSAAGFTVVWGLRGAGAAGGALPTLSDDIARLSDAHLTGSGETVLGHMTDDYIRVAQSRGASYFDLGDDVWRSLTPAQRWAANQRVLDAAIRNGDTITLATARYNVRFESSLHAEITYLRAHGYQWVDDFTLAPS